MTTFALVSPENEILRQEVDIDPTVSTREGFRWLEVEDVRPAPGPNQTLNGPAIEVGADKVRRVWTVVDRPPAAIEAEKDNQIEALNALTLAIGLDHENRLRALEGKPAVTAEQFRSALKARL